MKKFSTAALSLVLTASLSAPVLAAQTIMPISAPLFYGHSITVNGLALDTAGLPSVDAGYIPMRLVAESDFGSAYWSEEEGTGSFFMDGLLISVDFSDNSVRVEEKPLEARAIVKDGVTFLPVSILEGKEGYAVTRSDDGKIDITTPNSSDLAQLAYFISGELKMGRGMKVKPEELKANFDVPVESFTELVAFFPNIINPDTIVVGKLAEGADVAAIKAALEAYRQSQEDTFSWYLPQNLEKTQKAQTVVEDGYFLFLLAEGVDEGVELFRDFVAAQK